MQSLLDGTRTPREQVALESKVVASLYAQSLEICLNQAIELEGRDSLVERGGEEQDCHCHVPASECAILETPWLIPDISHFTKRCLFDWQES